MLINQLKQTLVAPKVQPKAFVGDYIVVDDVTLRVERVDTTDFFPLYHLSNGQVLGDIDFSFEDVLLESEVFHHG